MVFGFDIDAAFEFSFHTGLGQYSKTFGIEYNTETNALQAYDDTTNTFEPALDFAYGLNETNPDSCFTASFKPYLEISAGVQLYKSLGVTLEFPFNTEFTLTYPSADCGVPKCADNTDQKLELKFVEASLALNLIFSFSLKNNDLKTLLDILGIGDIDASHSIPLIPVIYLGQGGQSTCVDFNFAPILLVCCGSGIQLNSEDTYNLADHENSFSTVIVDEINNIPEFEVGNDAPIPNTVYQIKNSYNGVVTCMDAWSDTYGINIVKATSCSDSQYNYWIVQFRDATSYLQYRFLNLGTYVDDYPSFSAGFMTSNNGVMQLKEYNVDTGYPKAKNLTYKLEIYDWDENGTARFYIRDQNSNNQYLTKLTNNVGHASKYTADADKPKQLWSFKVVEEYELPTESIDYWITTSKSPENTHVGVPNYTSKFVEWVSNTNGYDRFVFHRITFEWVYIFLSPLYNLNGNRQLVCKGEGNDLEIANLNTDSKYCKWKLERQYQTNLYTIQSYVSSDYWDSSQEHPRRYELYEYPAEFSFTQVLPKHDLPNSDVLYRIKWGDNYLRCEDELCSTFSMSWTSNVNPDLQLFKFHKMNGLQDNMFFLSPYLNYGAAIKFSTSSSPTVGTDIYDNEGFVKEKYHLQIQRNDWNQDYGLFNYGFTTGFRNDEGYFIVKYPFVTHFVLMGSEYTGSWNLEATTKTAHPTQSPVPTTPYPTTPNPTPSPTVVPTSSPILEPSNVYFSINKIYCEVGDTIAVTYDFRSYTIQNIEHGWIGLFDEFVTDSTSEVPHEGVYIHWFRIDSSKQGTGNLNCGSSSGVFKIKAFDQDYTGNGIQMGNTLQVVIGNNFYFTAPEVTWTGKNVINIEYDFSAYPETFYTDAWIGLFPSNVTATDEHTNDMYWIDYIWIDSSKKGSGSLDCVDTGLYFIKAFDTDDNAIGQQIEVAQVYCEAPVDTPSNTYFYTNKIYCETGEYITVTYDFTSYTARNIDNGWFGLFYDSVTDSLNEVDHEPEWIDGYYIDISKKGNIGFYCPSSGIYKIKAFNQDACCDGVQISDTLRFVTNTNNYFTAAEFVSTGNNVITIDYDFSSYSGHWYYAYFALIPSNILTTDEVTNDGYDIHYFYIDSSRVGSGTLNCPNTGLYFIKAFNADWGTPTGEQIAASQVYCE